MKRGRCSEPNLPGASLSTLNLVVKNVESFLSGHSGYAWTQTSSHSYLQIYPNVLRCKEIMVNILNALKCVDILH